jgi:hypothetical protein
MPQHERPGVRNEIGFVWRQYGAKESEFLELAMLAERCSLVFTGKGKGRVVPEYPQEDQVMLVDRSLELVSCEQHSRRLVTAYKALVLPHGHKTAVVAFKRLGKPLVILAAFATAIDEGACKYILVAVIHRDSVPPESGSATLCFDFTAWAATPVEGIGILHVTRAAGLADRQVKLIVIGDAVQQVPAHSKLRFASSCRSR